MKNRAPWELSIGDTVVPSVKANYKEVVVTTDVVSIERCGTKRVTWRITWSDGTTHIYGANARFRTV